MALSTRAKYRPAVPTPHSTTQRTRRDTPAPPSSSLRPPRPASTHEMPAKVAKTYALRCHRGRARAARRSQPASDLPNARNKAPNPDADRVFSTASPPPVAPVPAHRSSPAPPAPDPAANSPAPSAQALKEAAPAPP